MTYTPNENFNGTDSFTFTVNDGTVDSTSATVTLTVNPVNDLPIAVAQSVQTNEGTPVNIVLTGTDVDGDTLTFSAPSSPTNGSLTGTAPNVTYTPNANFAGGDAFVFTVSDGVETSAVTVVTIFVSPVNEAPVAVDDELTLLAGQSGTVNVLANDTDADGDVLSLTSLTPPSHGTVDYNSDGSITYTASASFAGVDYVSYTVSDGVAIATGLLTINVGQVNRPPVVAAGDDQSVLIDQTEALSGTVVINNDDWMLGDVATGQAPSVKEFVKNLAQVYSGGSAAEFLIYSTGGTSTQFAGSQLTQTLVDEGHTVIQPGATITTLAELQVYDGVFLFDQIIDETILQQYIDQGGHVYVAGGVNGTEIHPWDAFLNLYGFDFGAPLNTLSGVYPINSSHPLLSNVEQLYFLNGNPLTKTGAASDFSRIIYAVDSENVLGTYGFGVAQAPLAATVSDDGLLAPFTSTWSVVSGPGEVVIDNVDLLQTTAHFALPGEYLLRITVSDGEYTVSDDVVIVVDENFAPIVSAGEDQSVSEINQSLALNGEISDDGFPSALALSIQWEKVGGPGLVTFTDPNAASTSVTFDTPGLYVLKLTGDDSIGSSSDLVEVSAASPCAVSLPPGAVAWWPGNYSLDERIQNLDARSTGQSSIFQEGHVSGAYAFDGSELSYQVDAHPSLDLGSGDGLTIEMWIKPDASSQTRGILEWNDGNQQGLLINHFGSRLDFRLFHDSGQDTVFANMTLGIWQHIALSYDKASGLAKIYINGILKEPKNIGSHNLLTDGDLFFNRRPGNTIFNLHDFEGFLDEVTLYSRALDASEISDIVAAGGRGKCSHDNIAPLVNAGPDLEPSTLTNIALVGQVADDGLPENGNLTSLWTKISGPGTATFVDASLAATSVTFSAPGTYLLSLEASDGLATNQDLIEVRAQVSCVAPPSGLISWWSLNNDLNDRIGGNHGMAVNGISFENTDHGSGLFFENGRIVEVPASPSLNVNQYDGFTIAFWLRPELVNEHRGIVEWNDGNEQGRFQRAKE